MKYFILAALICLVSCQKQETPAASGAPEVSTGAAALEDCDKKAAEKVEIKEEGISLSGGNTGCTLEEN